MSNNLFRPSNRVQELFKITYPIIQGGMIWNSGWRLAAAVSNAGGLGLLGAGSMYPDILVEHIKKCQTATNKPFGVNLPLLYPSIEEHIESILKYKIPIVFTSAGNPKIWTEILQKEGIRVVHVVSSSKFARKAEEAGVDAIVAEGFEAGGHNGRDETTTLCLIPDVRRNTSLPLIAAGGIATGQQMLATQILGAEGFQLGSRFAASNESSAHIDFKNTIIQAKEGATQLTLKELAPVRLIKNEFYQQIQNAYERCASQEDLVNLLGRGRAKQGMFQGNLVDGELEIGQCSSIIDNIESVADIFKTLLSEYKSSIQNLNSQA